MIFFGGGDLLLPRAATGDAEEEEDANASMLPRVAIGSFKDDENGDALPLDQGDGVSDNLPEDANKLGPLTLANGELVEANAINPLDDPEASPSCPSTAFCSGGGEGLLVSLGLSSLSASSLGLLADSFVGDPDIHFGPFTEANGELDPAYAPKPL
jgi:hypothetical protein